MRPLRCPTGTPLDVVSQNRRIVGVMDTDHPFRQSACRQRESRTKEFIMKGAVLHGPRDVRLEQRDDPTIVEATDAIIRLSATCVCGSDLWPYRGTDDYGTAAPMGHRVRRHRPSRRQ